ncbi:MAG: putative toxin-antitoxin system toxin component, PIN family [Syntrophomonadaceae bacterium]|nr:putative toxin-antitoxin system toxin component, PIN family [Syntrophomonadaceae bacterium]
MRVMIDTNIIISAIRNPNGTPFAAYAKAAQPPYKIVLCDQIIDEVRRVFNRKFPDSVPLIERFFTWALFEVVSTPGEDKRTETENMIRDVKDRPILRAALASKVDILITGDKDFLESGVKNPQIVTAAEFISDF